jgi:flagellar biogenesis protein FliO
MVRVFFLLLLSLTAPLSATETVPAEKEFLQEEPMPSVEKQTPLDSKALLIKTALLLAGIVGMLYGAAYFIKRIGGGRYSPSSGEGKIHLVERKYISPKTSVWLLEVENTSVIVVDSQNGVAVQPLSFPRQTDKELV